MRRFNTILKQNGMVFEAAPINAPAAPSAPSAQAPAPSVPDKQPTIDAQTPPPETKPLSPASYVTLVRLLRDAFVAKPSDVDAASVTEMRFKGADGADTGDINETNADAAFNQLLPIISKYAKNDIGVKDLLAKI